MKPNQTRILTRTALLALALSMLGVSGCATMQPADPSHEKERVCRPGSAIRYETDVKPTPGGLMRLAPPQGNCLYQ